MKTEESCRAGYCGNLGVTEWRGTRGLWCTTCAEELETSYQRINEYVQNNPLYSGEDLPDDD